MIPAGEDFFVAGDVENVENCEGFGESSFKKGNDLKSVFLEADYEAIGFNFKMFGIVIGGWFGAGDAEFEIEIAFGHGWKFTCWRG